MKKLLLCLLLLFFLPQPVCCAAGLGLDVSAVESELPEEARGVSGALTLDGSYDGASALSRLWQTLLDKLREELRRSASSAAALAAVAIFAGVAASVCPEPKAVTLINVVSAAAAALTLTDGIESVTAQAAGAIEQLADYSRAALPAIFTAAAATGMVVTSSARYAAVCLALDVLMTVSRRLTLPLIYACLAAAISGGIFPHPLIKGLGKLLRRAATAVMTGLTTVFTAYIGLTGIVTASADAAAVKAAKTVISGVLPVVGGIVSDAASSVLSAATLIKNSAGAFALVAVCALCAGPFAALSVRLLLFRAAAAVAEMAPGDRLPGLLNDLASVFALLLGLVGSFAVMLFFSFLAAIRVTAA